MQISVELQEVFSYMPVFIMALCAVCGGALILFWPKRKTKRQPKPSIPKPVKPSAQNLTAIKQKYMAVLTGLEQKRSNNQLTDRQAFQELSLAVRSFVFEATGIRVQNYTLAEIKAANLPRLYQLIEQCYVPEFAAKDGRTVYEIIHQARKVVEEWN